MKLKALILINYTTNNVNVVIDYKAKEFTRYLEVEVFEILGQVFLSSSYNLFCGTIVFNRDLRVGCTSAVPHAQKT